MSINFRKNLIPSLEARVEILDFEGNLVGENLCPETLTDDLIVELYDKMVMLRVVDQQALTLQRAGRMGTMVASIGAGSCQHWQCRCPGSRRLGGAVVSETGAMLLRGVPLKINLHVLDGMRMGQSLSGRRQGFANLCTLSTQDCMAWGLLGRRS